MQKQRTNNYFKIVLKDSKRSLFAFFVDTDPVSVMSAIRSLLPRIDDGPLSVWFLNEPARVALGKLGLLTDSREIGQPIVVEWQ